MPLGGGGTATKPAGTTAAASTTIESAKFNSVIDDIYSIFNTARPVAYGGTGATTAVAGYDALNTRGAAKASASTLNLDTATGPNLHITGTTTVTAVTLGEGKVRQAIADDAFQITVGSSLIVNGSASTNYTTTAGDLLIFIGEASNVVRVWTISAPSEGATVTGVNEQFIPASAFVPQITNGAALGISELSTNLQMLETLDFDTTTQEFASFLWAPPKRWDRSTVTAQFYWTAASGSGGVAWALQGVAVGDDDALNASWGTEQVATDTFIAANDMHVTAATSAITIGGSPADGDGVWLRVKRVPANMSDTLAVDAKLIGVKLFYTVDQGNDA